jgi:hypothetical protein
LCKRLVLCSEDRAGTDEQQEDKDFWLFIPHSALRTPH